MGSLKPGATYVYERVNGHVYAREFGETKRTLVGIELRQQESSNHKRMLSEMNEVLIMCETDPEMKELLDRLLVVYNLKKKDSPIAYHPV